MRLVSPTSTRAHHPTVLVHLAVDHRDIRILTLSQSQPQYRHQQHRHRHQRPCKSKAPSRPAQRLLEDNQEQRACRSPGSKRKRKLNRSHLLRLHLRRHLHSRPIPLPHSLRHKRRPTPKLKPNNHHHQWVPRATRCISIRKRLGRGLMSSWRGALGCGTRWRMGLSLSLDGRMRTIWRRGR